MSQDQSPHGGDASYRKLASAMLARRKLRNQFFDRQTFGEQRWDLMLVLFAEPRGSASVDKTSQLLGMPPATTLALARILAGHSLLELGDSDGGWSEIPISLSALGTAKMNGYFAELVRSDMADPG